MNKTEILSEINNIYLALTAQRNHPECGYSYDTEQLEALRRLDKLAIDIEKDIEAAK